MSAPPVCKISATILDVGEPLFSQLDVALPLDTVQSVFKNQWRLRCDACVPNDH